jgi:hypothetical protein
VRMDMMVSLDQSTSLICLLHNMKLQKPFKAQDAQHGMVLHVLIVLSLQANVYPGVLLISTVLLALHVTRFAHHATDQKAINAIHVLMIQHSHLLKDCTTTLSLFAPTVVMSLLILKLLSLKNAMMATWQEPMDAVKLVKLRNSLLAILRM